MPIDCVSHVKLILGADSLCVTCDVDIVPKVDYTTLIGLLDRRALFFFLSGTAEYSRGDFPKFCPPSTNAAIHLQPVASRK